MRSLFHPTSREMRLLHFERERSNSNDFGLRRLVQAHGRLVYYVMVLTLLGPHLTGAFGPQPWTSPRSTRFVAPVTQLRNAMNPNNQEKLDLRLLLIDHYDSFTYNLVDMLGQQCVHPPLVVAADSSPQELERIFNSGPIDGIVLSPGPGNPQTCGPLAVSVVQAHPDTPVLGVCLGHQILGTMYGATCTRAPTPVHGQVHPLQFLPTVQKDALWQAAFEILSSSSADPMVNENMDSSDNQDEWHVTRYHSLHVTKLEETPLIPTAITANDQVVMSFYHPTLPHFGVQFHPESIGSQHGWALLRSFCQICHMHKQSTRPTWTNMSNSSIRLNDNLPKCNGHFSTHQPFTNATTPSLASVPEKRIAQQFIQKSTEKLQTIDRSIQTLFNDSENMAKTSSGLHSANETIEVVVFKVPHSCMEPWNVMRDLLKDSNYRFWLDTADDRSNAVSILGTATTRIEYWGKECPAERQGVYVYENASSSPTEAKRMANLDILTFLERQLPPEPTNFVTFLRLDEKTGVPVPTGCVAESPNILPFRFRGGFVGYLGYEVRYDTTNYLAQSEGGQPRPLLRTVVSGSHSMTIPTAAFMLAEKSFIYRHDEKQWYLVGNVRADDPKSRENVYSWIAAQARLLQDFKPQLRIQRTQRVSDKRRAATDSKVNFNANRSRDTYNKNFESCLDQIRQGESYELCLTNHLEASVKTRSTPLDLYKILRHRNAAPYAAFFDWNSAEKSPVGISFAICSSSPERFVSVSPQPDGTIQVEAKPIKGTCARVLPQKGQAMRNDPENREDAQRAESLRLSVKNRAENLMIVDLLRNDLSRVCRTGSVHVAKLMDIESFATVHQMVSTIRGTLDTPLQSAISLLRASFPGGSMTGAPKLRTMEILNDLEEGVPRGPYSGCLGYVSLNGAMDMNIVIRSAVLTPKRSEQSWNVSIGAGGAITILSENEDEYEEMILKASAVVGAVEEWASLDSVTFKTRESNNYQIASIEEGRMG